MNGSQLFEHCRGLYEIMDEASEQASEGRVYKGFLTKEMPKLSLSQPYYTHIMRALKQMDCVQQIRRGGGGSPSIWLLKKPPTIHDFERMVGGGTTTLKGTGAGTKQQQAQAIREITRRLNDLDEFRDLVISVLVKHNMVDIEDPEGAVALEPTLEVTTDA